MSDEEFKQESKLQPQPSGSEQERGWWPWALETGQQGEVVPKEMQHSICVELLEEKGRKKQNNTR